VSDICDIMSDTPCHHKGSQFECRKLLSLCFGTVREPKDRLRRISYELRWRHTWAAGTALPPRMNWRKKPDWLVAYAKHPKT